MTDLLNAAAEALGTPPELVRRSAAARAAANGTTTDEVLEAWSGGAPVAAPTESAAPEPAEKPEPAEPAATETAPSEPEPLPASIPQPAAAAVAVEPEPEKAEPLQPVGISTRLRTAGRIGVWTGAILGFFAFVMAAASWSQTASVTGEETFSPVFIADASTVLLGVALVSIVFGAVVAALAREASSWANPAMQLASSKASTVWVGGVIGLLLGFAGGATLANGFGSPIEGSEGLIQLPVLPTLFVMLIGGALLGGLTSLITQFFGVPVAVSDEENHEIEAVRRRLGNAVGIPVAGLVLLLALVLPFAWTLIESNHLTSGGAAVIAIITAAGILTFASLAGSRPNVRISRGELLVAVAGIGIVILIIFAVITNLSSPAEETASGEQAAIVLQIS